MKCTQMIGSQLITQQTGAAGRPCSKVQLVFANLIITLLGVGL